MDASLVHSGDLDLDPKGNDGKEQGDETEPHLSRGLGLAMLTERERHSGTVCFGIHLGQYRTKMFGRMGSLDVWQEPVSQDNLQSDEGSIDSSLIYVFPRLPRRTRRSRTCEFHRSCLYNIQPSGDTPGCSQVCWHLGANCHIGYSLAGYPGHTNADRASPCYCFQNQLSERVCGFWKPGRDLDILRRMHFEATMLYESETER